MTITKCLIHIVGWLYLLEKKNKKTLMIIYINSVISDIISSNQNASCFILINFNEQEQITLSFTYYKVLFYLRHFPLGLGGEKS